MANSVTSLKNLGPTSAIMLREVGIKTSADLLSQDPIDVFILLKLFGYDVNMNMLWALYGAKNDMDWRDIDDATKEKLKAKLDEKEAD